jgi:HlyD family secretion protein
MHPIPLRGPSLAVAPATRDVDKGGPASAHVWRPLIALAALAAVVGGLQALRRPRRAAPPAYRTELVTRGSVVGTLRMEGRLQTQTTARVGSLSAGQVVAVAVDVGDGVRRGQVLARLDDLEQRAAVADADASADTAEIRRVRLEKRLGEELSRLDDAGSSAGDLGADDIFDGAVGDAQLDLMTAYVQVVRASSRRALARGILARRVVRSPIDGVVLARAVDPGETIGGSPPGPPLFVIGADPAHLRLEAELDAADAARVRPAPLKLAVPDYPRRAFTAVIRQVLPADLASAPRGVDRYRVVLDVENADRALRAGMTATFALPMETAATAVRVPLAALAPAPPHAGARDAVVWTVDAAGARTPVRVELGVVDERVAEIRAGSLRPGASVLVGAP